MSKDEWKAWRVRGWTKLNHKCDGCRKDHADLELRFSHNGLIVSRAWHWECLPEELKQFQAQDEAAMLQEAQRPFR